MWHWWSLVLTALAFGALGGTAGAEDLAALLRRHHGTEGPVLSVHVETRQDGQGYEGWVKDEATGTKVGGPFWHRRKILAVTLSPDRSRVATASEDRTAAVWDVASGRRVCTVGHEFHVHLVEFSPDGRCLLTGSKDETAVLWDAATGQRLRTMRHDGALQEISFHRRGERILTQASLQGWGVEAAVWDGRSEQPLFRVGRVPDCVRLAVLSPDGNRLLTHHQDKSTKVWDVQGQSAACQVRHTKWVSQMAFSPDGARFATAWDDGTAVVWDARTGAQQFLVEHDAAIREIVFSPDGRRLATASEDKTAVIWDGQSGKPLHQLEHAQPVNRVAFSPDGRGLVTTLGGWSFTTGETTAYNFFWDADTGKPLGRQNR